MLFSSVALLCFLVYCNSFIVKHSITHDKVSIGELYFGDHILHTIPFVNILAMAFIFGRYTILTPHLLKNRTRKRKYYDVSCPTKPFLSNETESLTRQKIILERAAHLTWCQRVGLLGYGFYYLFAPFFFVFTYMTVFNIDTIYGKMTLSEPVNDLIIFSITFVANITLILVSIYTIQARKRIKKDLQEENRQQVTTKAAATTTTKTAPPPPLFFDPGKDYRCKTSNVVQMQKFSDFSKTPDLSKT